MEKYGKFCAGRSKPELAEIIQQEQSHVSIVADGGHCSRRLCDDDARVIVDGVMMAGLLVESVSLRNHALGDSGASEIGRLLKFGGDDGEDVSSVELSHYHPVTSSLDLRGNSIGAAGCEALSTAMAQNSTLRKLDLSWNPLGKQGGYRIAELLSSTSSCLTEVDVGASSLDLSALVAILSVLRNPCCLKTLNISGAVLKTTEQEDNLASHIGSALAMNSTLETLQCETNRINDDGATIIAEALRKKNRTLTTLSLRANRIRAAGAAAFSDTLILRGSDGTLQNLDLCSNQIGDEGAAYLSEALSRDASLTHLDLAKNAIADEGLNELAQALAVNKQLKLMKAWGNDFGPKANETFHNFQTTPPFKRNNPGLRFDFKTYVVDGKICTAEQKITVIPQVTPRDSADDIFYEDDEDDDNNDEKKGW